MAPIQPSESHSELHWNSKTPCIDESVSLDVALVPWIGWRSSFGGLPRIWIAENLVSREWNSPCPNDLRDLSILRDMNEGCSAHGSPVGAIHASAPGWPSSSKQATCIMILKNGTKVFDDLHVARRYQWSCRTLAFRLAVLIDACLLFYSRLIFISSFSVSLGRQPYTVVQTIMSYSRGPQSPFDVKAVQVSDLSPWRIFDRVWTAGMGYPADELDITPGATPLLTLQSTAMMLVSYYTIVLGGRELMRSRPAFKLNDLFLIHNFYLTAISGALLVLFIEQLGPTIWKHGVFFAICGDGGWSGPLVTLYYVC